MKEAAFPSQPPPEAVNSNALVVENLRKVYPSRGGGAAGLEALKGVSLSVETGEFFALLGPNGAGKSTLIGILSGLVNKTSGRVEVFGHDLDKEPGKLKSCLGLVPQEFNFNIFETVFNTLVFQGGFYGLPRKLAEERAEKYLTPLELWGRRNEPGRNLSGGMKRRLMLARALVHEPKLLILDEPTAGLDIELRHHLWDFLKGLNERGTTIILTTHYLEEAEQLCRRVAIIDHGTVLQDLPIKQLLAQSSSQTFVLDVASEVPELQLNGFPTARVDAHTLEVEVSNAHSLNEVFKQLGEKGLEVRSMRPKSNRLEELFLKMVTRSGNLKKL